jgi:predicted  nucleic acid-binding Zn-ribbon protein
MTEDDMKELLRLSGMLQEIDRLLDSASPMREALAKADIALSNGFNQGWRSEIEFEHQWLQNLRKQGT